MKIDTLSEFIWEHILEETSYGGNIRCLACGCVVLQDGDNVVYEFDEHGESLLLFLVFLSFGSFFF